MCPLIKHELMSRERCILITSLWYLVHRKIYLWLFTHVIKAEIFLFFELVPVTAHNIACKSCVYTFTHGLLYVVIS